MVTLHYLTYIIFSQSQAPAILKHQNNCDDPLLYDFSFICPPLLDFSISHAHAHVQPELSD